MQVDGDSLDVYGRWRLPELQKFAESLEKHIEYVREAGRMVGVPESQLACHDDSKWGDFEFPRYAAQFFGPKIEDPAEIETRATRFAEAWLHHIHHNPHHWQYWIFPDGFSPKGSAVEDGAVRMPDNYIREMVADWMGAEMAYNGSWDMTKWLNGNLPRIRIHSYVREELVYILSEIGYRYTYDMLANRHTVIPKSETKNMPKNRAIGHI